MATECINVLGQWFPPGCTIDNNPPPTPGTPGSTPPPLTAGQQVTLANGIMGLVVSIIGGIITLRTAGGETVQAPVADVASVSPPPATTSSAGFFQDPAFLAMAFAGVMLVVVLSGRR